MALRAAELMAMYQVDESELDNSLGSLPGKVAKIAGIIGGGMALGSALSESMDIQAGQAKLTAQLGLTSQESAQAGKMAGQLYAQNYGDSLDQVNDAVAAVYNNIGYSLDDADFSGITKKVLDLASTFDVDLGGATAAIGQLMKTGLAKDANEALDIVTRGFQLGNDKAGDWLDTLNEYGVQFQKLGIDGATATNLISQGLIAGARDSDLVADAIKEFSIRAVDGSQTTAQGFEAIGLNAQTMAERIGAGGTTARDALAQTLDKLRAMTDPVQRAQAATALFGTQAEDLGSALFTLNPKPLNDVAGAADRMDQTIGSTASGNLQTFLRTAQQLAVNVLGQYLIPAITTVAAFLSSTLGPAVTTVGGWISGTLVPALKSAAEWVDANRTPIQIVAALILAVFLPALIAMGVQSTISAAMSIAAWVAQKASAIGSVAVQSAQIVAMIARYVALGVAATAQAAVVGAAWVGAQIRTVASLVVMAAGFVAQGAVMVASAVATAASVVAGWVVMGTQSLIQAARMAAAWVIAMGPVGWIIALVVGLVALIVANWDTVVGWTKAAWNWVVGIIGGAWDWIKSAVSSAVDFVLGIIGWFGELPGKIATWFGGVKDAALNKLGELISWLGGLPGRILGAIGDFGAMLLNAGKDLLTGLWNGIKGAAAWLWDKIKDFFGSLLPGWVKDMLGISSPSKVFAELGKYTMLGFGQGIDDHASAAIDAASRAAAAVTDAMQVTPPDLAAMANDQAMAALQARTPGSVLAANASTAAAPGGDTGAGGRGPLFAADTVNVIEGTPDDVARQLELGARTRGNW